MRKQLGCVCFKLLCLKTQSNRLRKKRERETSTNISTASSSWDSYHVSIFETALITYIIVSVIAIVVQFIFFSILLYLSDRFALARVCACVCVLIYSRVKRGQLRFIFAHTDIKICYYFVLRTCHLWLRLLPCIQGTLNRIFGSLCCECEFPVSVFVWLICLSLSRSLVI